MIRLIRSDGLEFLLNLELIKSIEGTEKPVIILKTGDKIKVKNSERDIMQKIRAYRLGKSEDEKSS